MSAPAFAERPALTIRGTRYPVLLPTVRDPRLHLAAVIITLQVLGQTAFGFNVSIAQILIAIGTCAVLEVGIAFFRQSVIMWPASAMLTGNGVAFILRVPGTSTATGGACTARGSSPAPPQSSLLSKYVIRCGGAGTSSTRRTSVSSCASSSSGRPAPSRSTSGGARCRAGWRWRWRSSSSAASLILSRLRLLPIAVGFWLAFAAGIGVLAAERPRDDRSLAPRADHGRAFWWVLVTSPEILIFLFFMITDPKTIPRGRAARRRVRRLSRTARHPPDRAQTTEYATKVAVLSALALVCLFRPLLEWLLPAEQARARGWTAAGSRGRGATGGLAIAAAAVLPGSWCWPAFRRAPAQATAGALPAEGPIPQVTIATNGVSARVDPATARQIAGDIVADLQAEADALRLRDPERAAVGAGGARLVDLRADRTAAGRGSPSRAISVERVGLTLSRAEGQAPPRIVATIKGTEQVADIRRPAADARATSSRGALRAARSRSRSSRAGT